MLPAIALRARLLGLAAIMVASSYEGLASADAESDAKDLFTRGREMRAHGNCVDALKEFHKAVAIYPTGLGSFRNIAECEEQLGHWASARRTWIDLKRALLTTQDRKYDGWDAEAEAASARLAPKTARLTVDVVITNKKGEAPATDKSPVVVFVNNESLPDSLVGTALDRDPGSYRVRVERSQTHEGGPPEQSVFLAPGDDKHVKFTVNEVEAPEAFLPPPAPPEDTKRGRRMAGWISLGVGAASLVGAGVSLLVRQSAASDLDRACSTHHGCSPSLQSTVDRGQLASTLTNVFGAVGIFGVGAGATLILISPAPSGRAGQTPLVVRPLVGRVNGASVQWSLP